MAKKESIIFFGTGPVALASITALSEYFYLEASITKPGHTAHSGVVVEQSLKLWSESNGIPCFQPSGKTDLDKLFKDHSFKSRLGVVVDYGILIPLSVIESFELGIVNSHFSLLPEHRGPDPITAAILSGQKKTGVSLMLIVEKLDEGPLLAQAEYEIPADVIIDRLTVELTGLSNALLISILPKYLAGKISPYPQPSTKQPNYTRKVAKADGNIDWNKPANQIEREIRAYLGWPGSRTTIGGRDVIITKADASPTLSGESRPGSVTVSAKKDSIKVATSEGVLNIYRLKPAGKKDMSAPEFIRGYLR